MVRRWPALDARLRVLRRADRSGESPRAWRPVRRHVPTPHGCGRLALAAFPRDERERSRPRECRLRGPPATRTWPNTHANHSQRRGVPMPPAAGPRALFPCVWRFPTDVALAPASRWRTTPESRLKALPRAVVALPRILADQPSTNPCQPRARIRRKEPHQPSIRDPNPQSHGRTGLASSSSVRRCDLKTALPSPRPIFCKYTHGERASSA